MKETGDSKVGGTLKEWIKSKMESTYCFYIGGYRVGNNSQLQHIEVVCREENNHEGFCGLQLWWPSTVVPAVVPLRMLQKKITPTFQRHVILDA